LAVGSALSFGVGIVINRSLAKTGLGAPTVLGWRFGTAAAVLLLVALVVGAPLAPAPGERVLVFLLGAVGYMLESTLFFMGLERGTAAAVSLLFYTYPGMVTVASIGLGWERPRARSFLALALAAGGSVLVVAAGARVSISQAGIVCAVGSAASFTVYLLVSDRSIKHTEPLTTGAWMALGAACGFLTRGVSTGALHAPGSHVVGLLANGLTTTSAFVLMFAALKRLGPTRTSVVLTLEAPSAIVLAAVFLGESLRPLQALGGIAIVAATAMVAAGRRQPVEAAEPP